MECTDFLGPSDTFPERHLGSGPAELDEMLSSLGVPSLDDLVHETIPESIRMQRPLDLPPATVEHLLLEQLADVAARNRVQRSLIGQGYYDCITPPVVLRNILENPGWYTQYTPYQAEISQGRLEVMLTFQTMVADLCGLSLANASLLDEATAAAEALSMCHALLRGKRSVVLVAEECFPQTIEVVRTRARGQGLELRVAPTSELDPGTGDVCGVLVQYPDRYGQIGDHRDLVDRAHAAGAKVAMATDLLALCVLQPPGELGADIAVGSSQRFGVPLGLGGPHAAFLAAREEYKRRMPGRIIGISRDAQGRQAFRMAIQTREQHIRREKATSNICTAQVLLAIMAALYGAWHGPAGLRRIARRVQGLTTLLGEGLRRQGHRLAEPPWFDTLRIWPQGDTAAAILERARSRGINLWAPDADSVSLSLDERSTRDEVQVLLEVFAGAAGASPSVVALEGSVDLSCEGPWSRSCDYLQHEVFSLYQTEHEMLRYLHRLQTRDLSLTTSMIPLGSCTMKLNATSEMQPISWPAFARIHPFAPPEQWEGYRQVIDDLCGWLGEITGLPAVTMQPNSGAQGEYTGLMLIRAYHQDRGQPDRDVCLIPVSAHGTNPASAITAGYRVVSVACDQGGNVDLEDLRTQVERHREQLGALMVTYPSTHGVFEEDIAKICQVVHEAGGQVYMDGANLNAMVGLCRPGEFGADVCHLNLHKTFSIPHGGGGPGMGPVCAASHLAPFLPGHPLTSGVGGERAIGPVSASAFGSPSILPISWMYIRLMGPEGLTAATHLAILNANYMAHRLEGQYQILYRGARGRVAHEFIVDMRPFKESAGIEVDDIAKRLMDYGFHAPTMSFPVPGTLMIEPTETESKAELDRLCEALLQIREEIRAVEEGRADREDNLLHGAPHSAHAVATDAWAHAYSREDAAFPAPWVRRHKFWPPVGRIDNVFGDRNLVANHPLPS
jgi:glycine dehydrogenase